MSSPLRLIIIVNAPAPSPLLFKINFTKAIAEVGAHRTELETKDAIMGEVRAGQIAVEFLVLLVGIGYTQADASFFVKQRSQVHTSELHSLMSLSYAVFSLKKIPNI